MAIVALENFKNLTASAIGAGKFGNLPAAAASGQSGAVVDYNGKKWLWYNSTASTYFRLSLKGLISAGTSKIIFGFRLYRSTTAAVTFGVFGLTTSLNPTYTFAANQQEVYFEIVVDRSGLSSGGQPLVDLYADGVFVSRYVSYAASLLTNLQAVTSDFYIVAGLNTRITDFYVVEDTQDDTPCDRLGPQNIVNVDLEVAANDGWNVTALADTLTREMGATDTGTRITGTGTNAELGLKPAASFSLTDQTSRVNGVFLRAQARYSSAADLQGVVKRTARSINRTGDIPAVIVASDPSNVFRGDSSQSDAEYVPATALDGLEFALKVVNRY